tara:strand:+ start:103 stop:711 length:609 start_codon:yes stop_codon:yes gene_type:complete
MRYFDPFKISGEDISSEFVKDALQESKKLYEKKDSVSKKISKLKDEGKPQDQAVAIALDMEERGDLDEASTPKILRKTRKRAQAGKPIKKGTAKIVANDPEQDLDVAIKAGDKLTHQEGRTITPEEQKKHEHDEYVRRFGKPKTQGGGETTDNKGNKVYNPKNPKFKQKQKEREEAAQAYKDSMNNEGASQTIKSRLRTQKS